MPAFSRHHNPPRLCALRGFTLVELMVTLIVAAILVTVAVPGFRSLIRSNQVTTQANDLLTAFQIARNEALKRRTTVSVCSRKSPATSPETCAGSNDWSTGWLVFADTNADGSFDSGEELIRVGDPVGGSATVSGSANFFSWLSSGISNGSGTITITPTDCQGSQRRVIRINTVGRARVDEENCP